MSETLNDAFAIRGLLSGLHSPDVCDGRRFGLIFFLYDAWNCGFHAFSERPLSSGRAEL